jgi:excinuclease ABC subunit C
LNTQDYQQLAPTLPTQPGIYKFVDDQGVIIYVGKAKNLKNRLSSYFGERKDRLHKTRALVRNADHIEYMIVESEQDALLLESTLIKKYQPRYNVMLKDGKSYPYICIKNERFPRVFTTRRVVRDGSQYFGPYANGTQVFILMDLIKHLFPLRTCNFALSKESIEKKKFKVCLEYHIKNCMGACANLETEEAYNEKIIQIKNILKGQLSSVKNYLKQQMQVCAINLDFEQAQQLKEKTAIFEDYQGKSTVVSTTIQDVDVFSIATDEKMAYIQYLKVINGAIIHTYTLEVAKINEQDETELLELAIPYLQEKFNSITKEIIVPFELTPPDPEMVVLVPKIGDKKKLLELSEKNVKYYLMQKQKDDATRATKETSAERILKTLQSDLGMDSLPIHIECFDNSNLQGTNPVSSCVVFRNAKPAKRDYRHFNVKTVEGPNDFASMEEVVFRRYKRLLAEGTSLPQLIVIDGGKGQLSSAMKSLTALGIETKVTVIGIAKQLEEIFFPNDGVPLYINKKSESLKLIQQCRDEAHRFGITFHRNQRSKNFITTELTGIEGIGSVLSEKLLTHFGSVTKIKAATSEELAAVIGKAGTKKVKTYFLKNQSPPQT